VPGVEGEVTRDELRDLPLGTRITPPDGDDVASLYKHEGGYWIALSGESCLTAAPPALGGVPADYVVAWLPECDVRQRSDAHALDHYNGAGLSVAYLDLVSTALGPDWPEGEALILPPLSTDAQIVYEAIRIRARDHAATARPSDRERILRMYVPAVARLLLQWPASVRTDRAWVPR
jgi:hypothetical protein